MASRARSCAGFMVPLLTASLMSSGCVMAPMPGPTYYVVSADASVEASVATEDGLKLLDPRAIEALRPGLTVAFFPPDICRGDLSAAVATATPEATDMANYCGVLISALETSVADRYSVVSWQTIKGSDPFDRAAARNVDIIFEVDSMGMNAVSQDGSSQLRLDFHQQSTASDRRSLTLGSEELPTIASRCKAGVEQIQASQPAMVRSFTGAIKAVEVSTGQALVYYSRTLTEEPSSASRESLNLYYAAQPINDTGSAPFSPLQRAGGAAATLGFGLGFTGGFLRGVVYTGALNDADKNREPGTSASVAMLVTGIVLLAGGATAIAIGNAKAKRSVRDVRFQPPADVLCMQPTIPPWLQVPTPTPQGGSSYSFSETHTAERDVYRERENRLRKLLIDDFTRALAGLDP